MSRPVRSRRGTLLGVVYLALFALLVSAVIYVFIARAPPPRAARATVATGNPLGTVERDARDAAFDGRVEQLLPAGSYAYLGLRDERAGALRWAVTLGKGEPVGARVRIRSFGHRSDFYSRRLARTFPELTFGIATRL